MKKENKTCLIKLKQASMTISMTDILQKHSRKKKKSCLFISILLNPIYAPNRPPPPSLGFPIRRAGHFFLQTPETLKSAFTWHWSHSLWNGARASFMGLWPVQLCMGLTRKGPMLGLCCCNLEILSNFWTKTLYLYSPADTSYSWF